MDKEILLTVYRETFGGKRIIAVDWSPHLHDALEAEDDIGQRTDRLIEMVEELEATLEEARAEAESEDEQA